MTRGTGQYAGIVGGMFSHGESTYTHTRMRERPLA